MNFTALIALICDYLILLYLDDLNILRNVWFICYPIRANVIRSLAIEKYINS